MDSKLNCSIIQDILPNYIEGLTSDITNKAIQDHLASCADCRKALENMTSEMEETNGMKVVPPKQINFLKKIKLRQWKVAGMSVLVSVIVLLCVFYFIGTRDFPVSGRDITIGDVYQMKDGSIHYSISANVNGYVSNTSSQSDGESEIIRIYEHRRLNSSDGKNIILIPEKWSPLSNSNSAQEKTAIYYEGNGQSDRILIWKKGMELPKANAEQEAHYQTTRTKNR
ncbi:zf-HC2 domain-containing protein [Paenibacillus periandrae]|uniref:zf-HC2 domain-containing protein n=1 Tax=Paenibacillus periandrae TaxID=1761741 RepID=UPI001F08DF1F|nr:zf-HC2 domain-containing protein [Paenibacillus periandrae]